MWCGVDEVVGEVRLPEPYAAEVDRYWLHPALFDSCFQLAGRCLARMMKRPLSAASICRSGRIGWRSLSGPAIKSGATPASSAMVKSLLSGDLQLFDQTGRLIARLTGLHLRRANRETLRRAAQAASVESIARVVV